MRNQAKRAVDRLKCASFVEPYVLATEDPNKFYACCDQVFLEHRPCGASEDACALTIGKLLWRKLRPKPLSVMCAQQERDGPSASDEVIISWEMEHSGRTRREVEEELCDRIEKNPEHQSREPVIKDKEEPAYTAADREFTAELDAQLSHARDRFADLKRMKNRAGSARYVLAKRARERFKDSGIAESFLLFGEKPEEFYDLCDQVFVEYRPCGSSEEDCAFSLAKSLWRMIQLHPSSRLADGDSSEPWLDSMHDSIVAWSMPVDAHNLSEPEYEAIRAKIDREIREKAKARYLNDIERKHSGKPELNLDTLRADGKSAAALADKFIQAVQRMVKLKQMKRRAA